MGRWKATRLERIQFMLANKDLWLGRELPDYKGIVAGMRKAGVIAPQTRPDELALAKLIEVVSRHQLPCPVCGK